MTQLFQQLESRVLLSAVTSATLATDQATILADARTLTTEVKAEFSNTTVDSKVVVTAFKALPKLDQSFLAPFEKDFSKGNTSLAADVNKVVGASESLVKRSVAQGNSLLKKATVPGLAALEKDITSLQTITATPLATLQTALSSGKVSTDIGLIEAAFPGNSSLFDALQSLANNIAAGNSSVFTAAEQYQTDLGALAGDLQTLHTQLGTFPNVVAAYDGTATVTSGKNSGEVLTGTMSFTSEDPDTGALVGTLVNTDGGADALTGTITLNGAFKLKATGALIGTITGQVNDTSLTGTFVFKGQKGVFAFSERAIG